jgi:hypothetical protein
MILNRVTKTTSSSADRVTKTNHQTKEFAVEIGQFANSIAQLGYGRGSCKILPRSS